MFIMIKTSCWCVKDGISHPWAAKMVANNKFSSAN